MVNMLAEVKMCKDCVYQAWRKNPMKAAMADYYRKKYEDGICEIMCIAGLTWHHTAVHPGGIRKLDPVSAEVKEYDGRFGVGFTVHRYKKGSDNSHYVDYWIKED